MKKPLQLRIDGKKVVVGGPGPKHLKAIATISKLRGGYLTIEGVAKMVGCDRKVIAGVLKLDAMKGYYTVVPQAGCRLVVIGSKQSIAKLNKELEQ